MKLLSQSELEILLKEKASIDYEKQWDDYKNNNSKKIIHSVGFPVMFLRIVGNT